MKLYIDSEDITTADIELTDDERANRNTAADAFSMGIIALMIKFSNKSGRSVENIHDHVKKMLDDLMKSAAENADMIKSAAEDDDDFDDDDDDDFDHELTAEQEKQRRRDELYNNWLKELIRNTSLSGEADLIALIKKHCNGIIELHGCLNEDKNIYKLNITRFTDDAKIINVKNIDLDSKSEEMIRAELMSVFFIMRMLFDKVCGSDVNVLNMLDKDFLFDEYKKTSGRGFVRKLDRCTNDSHLAQLKAELEMLKSKDGLLARCILHSKKVRDSISSLSEEGAMEKYELSRKQRDCVFKRIQQIRQLIKSYENS